MLKSLVHVSIIVLAALATTSAAVAQTPTPTSPDSPQVKQRVSPAVQLTAIERELAARPAEDRSQALDQFSRSLQPSALARLDFGSDIDDAWALAFVIVHQNFEPLGVTNRDPSAGYL